MSPWQQLKDFRSHRHIIAAFFTKYPTHWSVHGHRHHAYSIWTAPLAFIVLKFWQFLLTQKMPVDIPWSPNSHCPMWYLNPWSFDSWCGTNHNKLIGNCVSPHRNLHNEQQILEHIFCLYQLILNWFHCHIVIQIYVIQIFLGNQVNILACSSPLTNMTQILGYLLQVDFFNIICICTSDYTNNCRAY